MGELFQQAAIFLLIPLTAIVAGGALGLFWEPSALVKSAIQRFAAGVVMAAVGLELFPRILEEERPLIVIASFAAGAIFVLAMRWMISRAEGIKIGLFTEESFLDANKVQEDGRVKSPKTLTAAVAVDVFVDGILIGLGFAIGEEVGILLAIGLGIEHAFLGLSSGNALDDAGVTRKKAFTILGALGAAVAIGGALGLLVLGELSQHYIRGMFAFGAAALLYLITEELLAEAQAEGTSLGAIAAFFLGFLVFYALDRF
jgi:zinc transporter, ZIP family